MALVIDASVVGAWFFRDESSAYADAALGTAIEGATAVPSVWPYEVANMFAIAERRGRIGAEDVATALAAISALSVDVHQPYAARALPGLVSVARDYGLTAHDAAYLELAIRTKSALATLDAALEQAAARAGVTLLSV